MRKPLAATSVAFGLAVAMSAAGAGVAAADDQVTPSAPAAAPAATTTATAITATVPAIADDDPSLAYEQNGAVVTITRKSAPVATVTLASADYAARSAKVVLTVAAKRPFTIDPVMFTLYDAQGWENDPIQTKPVRFRAGTGSLTLTFTGTPARPEAVGWVPRADEAAVAVWERG